MQRNRGKQQNRKIKDLIKKIRDTKGTFHATRRDKKAFLSDQCKEISENNRMRKTRNLLKKIRDTKGTFI